LVGGALIFFIDEKKLLSVIIYFDNRDFCVQRPENKLSYISEKFEFPRKIKRRIKEEA
jgi:8-oxo-dGTP diphosphatase